MTPPPSAAPPPARRASTTTARPAPHRGGGGGGGGPARSLELHVSLYNIPDALASRQPPPRVFAALLAELPPSTKDRGRVGVARVHERHARWRVAGVTEPQLVRVDASILRFVVPTHVDGLVGDRLHRRAAIAVYEIPDGDDGDDVYVAADECVPPDSRPTIDTRRLDEMTYVGEARAHVVELLRRVQGDDAEKRSRDRPDASRRVQYALARNPIRCVVVVDDDEDDGDGDLGVSGSVTASASATLNPAWEGAAVEILASRPRHWPRPGPAEAGVFFLDAELVFSPLFPHAPKDIERVYVRILRWVGDGYQPIHSTLVAHGDVPGAGAVYAEPRSGKKGAVPRWRAKLHETAIAVACLHGGGGDSNAVYGRAPLASAVVERVDGDVGDSDAARARAARYLPPGDVPWRVEAIARLTRGKDVLLGWVDVTLSELCDAGAAASEDAPARFDCELVPHESDFECARINPARGDAPAVLEVYGFRLRAGNGEKARGPAAAATATGAGAEKKRVAAAAAAATSEKENEDERERPERRERMTAMEEAEEEEEEEEAFEKREEEVDLDAAVAVPRTPAPPSAATAAEDDDDPEYTAAMRAMRSLRVDGGDDDANDDANFLDDSDVDSEEARLDAVVSGLSRAARAKLRRTPPPPPRSSTRGGRASTARATRPTARPTAAATTCARARPVAGAANRRGWSSTLSKPKETPPPVSMAQELRSRAYDGAKIAAAAASAPARRKTRTMRPFEELSPRSRWHAEKERTRGATATKPGMLPARREAVDRPPGDDDDDDDDDAVSEVSFVAPVRALLHRAVVAQHAREVSSAAARTPGVASVPAAFHDEDDEEEEEDVGGGGGGGDKENDSPASAPTTSLTPSPPRRVASDHSTPWKAASTSKHKKDSKPPNPELIAAADAAVRAALVEKLASHTKAELVDTALRIRQELLVKFRGQLRWLEQRRAREAKEAAVVYRASGAGKGATGVARGAR